MFDPTLSSIQEPEEEDDTRDTTHQKVHTLSFNKQWSQLHLVHEEN